MKISKNKLKQANTMRNRFIISVSIFFFILMGAGGTQHEAKAITGLETLGLSNNILPLIKTYGSRVAKAAIDIPKETLKVLYLPLGVVQSTVGAPFGMFKPGLKNIAKGFVAPFKGLYKAVELPFVLLGML